MRDNSNILSHELIGLDTTIIKSNSSTWLGLSGTIIDETKSTLTINTSKGTKMIPKHNNFWHFNLHGENITINGKSLLKRPWERLGERT